MPEGPRPPKLPAGYLAALFLACPVLVAAISAAAASEQRRSAEAMADGAVKFLASLDPARRARATIPLEDPQRFDWGFTPRPRKGISMGELDAGQRELARALLSAGLSQSGYRTALDIIALETVLRELGGGSHRNPDLYSLSIFGTPSTSSAWGWRFEGHHLSVNYTLAGGAGISWTPSFFGANPATVPVGARRGQRTLAAEEDGARELLRSLDPGQRARAIFAKAAPDEIVTGTEERVDPLAPAGIPARDLRPEQRRLLESLLDAYLARMPEDLASERRTKLQGAGLESVAFAWAGGSKPGQPHYYRIQGPTFLVEFDNTQDQANHIHTVWRDFAGDFGRDLLREHYRATPHRG